MNGRLWLENQAFSRIWPPTDQRVQFLPPNAVLLEAGGVREHFDAIFMTLE